MVGRRAARHGLQLRLAGNECWDRAGSLTSSSTRLPLRAQVFVTAQARTIDLATVLAQGSGLLVLVSPGTKQQLAERLDKYIFPGDQVQT